MLTDGQTDGRTLDGRTDDGVTGILLAHPRAFGSGELKMLTDGRTEGRTDGRRTDGQTDGRRTPESLVY